MFHDIIIFASFPCFFYYVFHRFQIFYKLNHQSIDKDSTRIDDGVGYQLSLILVCFLFRYMILEAAKD